MPTPPGGERRRVKRPPNKNAAVQADGHYPAVNQTVRLEAELTVGAVGQSVEVSGQAVQIRTDSSTVQGAVQSEVINVLPNPTNNPLYYAVLQAGVAPRMASGDTTSLNSFGVGGVGRRQWSTLGVNGGGAYTNDNRNDAPAIHRKSVGVLEVRTALTLGLGPQ